MEDLVDPDYPTERLFASRLNTKSEAGGKTRIFAQVDYWTQVALQDLHHYLMDELKLYPCDATFDQEQGARLVRSYTRRYKEVYSFDLTAATDLLPRKLQVHVLARYIGKDLAAL